MEILKTGALVKHRFSWPVMSAAAVLSIAITAAPALGQASGDQTPRSHSERKSVMTMKNDLANRSLDINWPKGFTPAEAELFSHNELLVNASCERVWRHIVEATKWPEWYPNSKNVQILGDQDSVLKSGSAFRWTTFNLPLESRINEFVPFSRISWFGVCTWYRAEFLSHLVSRTAR
jgi:hypothetical protein